MKCLLACINSLSVIITADLESGKSNCGPANEVIDSVSDAGKSDMNASLESGKSGTGKLPILELSRTCSFSH